MKKMQKNKVLQHFFCIFGCQKIGNQNYFCNFSSKFFETFFLQLKYHLKKGIAEILFFLSIGLQLGWDSRSFQHQLTMIG